MIQLDGPPRAACDGITRQKAARGRRGRALRPEPAARARGRGRAQADRSAPRAKSVIFINLFGGPSQLETFDLKPDAPEKIRGPFRPIACRTPGLLISEHLPMLAQVSDKFCVVRTMTHPYNDHSGAAHYIQTGKMWQVPDRRRLQPHAGRLAVDGLGRRVPEPARVRRIGARPAGLRRAAQLAGPAPGVRPVSPPRRARRLARAGGTTR